MEKCPLTKNGKDLSLYVFVSEKPASSVFHVQMDYDLNSAKGSVQSRSEGEVSYIDHMPVVGILDAVQLPEATFKLKGPGKKAKAQGIETFAGSLEMSTEKFKKVLTKTDIQALNRIVKKLRNYG